MVWVAGCGNDAKPSYTTAAVERGSITEVVTATGTVNPVTSVQVGSQVSGTIQEILVDFNSPVRKGQVIARIDPRLFEAQVAQARAGLESARAAAERAAVQEADAERTLRRTRELAALGFAPRADEDAAQTAYDAARAQRRSALAQVAQARAALDLAETNLRYTTIRSPVDGIVVSRNVDAGQTVAASFQTPTLFTIARDLTRMQIDANVDESDIARVRPGQTVSFTVDAYPERTFQGTVHQVRTAPQVTQNVVTYDVVIRVRNDDLSLKPGMTANVSIRIREVRDALKVPNAALRFRPQGASVGSQGRGARVFVPGKNGQPKPVSVTPGISDGAFTQILAGDLRPGDRVIVAEAARRRPAAASPPGFGMGGFR